MFKAARFKLTAWYLLIITVICVAFSATLYRVLTAEFDRFAKIQRIRLESRLPLPPVPRTMIYIDPDLVEETEHRLLYMFIAINSVIVVISGGLAYLLAGKTLKPIQQMLDDQNQFISDSSHELRTPLTSLKSSLEVALRGGKISEEEYRTLIGENLIDVNRLQTLTDRLMQLSKFSQVKSEVQLEKIRLSTVVADSIRQVSPQAVQKHIKIVDQTKDIKLYGSTDHLIELLTVLLENAIKYSANQTEITLSSKRTDGHILLKVADHGIGISDKNLPHIFDRFFRADTARSKDSTSGFGLGLSIAKQIVELHKGSLSVESKLGQGTTFTIKLPILPVGRQVFS